MIHVDSCYCQITRYFYCGSSRFSSRFEKYPSSEDYPPFGVRTPLQSSQIGSHSFSMWSSQFPQEFFSFLALSLHRPLQRTNLCRKCTKIDSSEEEKGRVLQVVNREITRSITIQSSRNACCGQPQTREVIHLWGLQIACFINGHSHAKTSQPSHLT